MMNKIKYLLIVLVAVFIYSCQEDFETPPAPPSYNNVGPVVTNGVDDTTAVLLKENEDVAWDTLAWNAAVLYEGQGLITHYAVQIDEQGNNFSSLFEIESSTTSETEIVITVGNLNTKLIANGYSPVQTYDLQLRIKAFVHEDLDSLFTDPISFTVTTYLDIANPDELYLFGDATTVGWGADTSLAMYKDGDKFIKFTYLENNKKFRFLKAQNTEDNTYNSGSLVNLPDNVEIAGDVDKNFLFTGTSGWYKIEADYLTSVLTIETYEHNGHTYVEDYDKLYLVGSISGWDAEANPPQFEMTKLSEGIFTYEIALPDGSQFKFVTGNGSWSPNWANIGGQGNTGILGPEGKNDNITFDGGDLTYKIEVNIKQGTYKITQASIYVPDNLYVLGGSLSNGWSPGDGIVLQKPSEGIFEIYIYIEVAGDGFLTLEQKEADNWSNKWSTDNSMPGTIVYEGPNNFTVSEDGFYLFNMNILTKKYETTKTSWGIIGDATPDGWETDTDMVLEINGSTYKGSYTWTVTTDLVVGEVKFRANDAWDINFGDGFADNGIDPDGFLDRGGDNLTISEAGNYTVTMTLHPTDGYTYTVVKN